MNEARHDEEITPLHGDDRFSCKQHLRSTILKPFPTMSTVPHALPDPRNVVADPAAPLSPLQAHASHPKPSPASTMSEPLPPASQGIICFDDDHRVLIVSSIARDLADVIFATRPRVGSAMPDALRKLIVVLKNQPARSASASALRHFRKDGHSISVRLAIDPQGNNHCLIFESVREFSSPDQIKGLGLSPRETHVAFWVIHHKTNWEISRILQISPRTVDKHVEKIFSKLKVNDRRDLIVKEIELRLA